MGTPGARVVGASGAASIGPSGAARVKNSAGECPKCCGGCAACSDYPEQLHITGDPADNGNPDCFLLVPGAGDPLNHLISLLGLDGIADCQYSSLLEYEDYWEEIGGTDSVLIFRSSLVHEADGVGGWRWRTTIYGYDGGELCFGCVIWEGVLASAECPVDPRGTYTKTGGCLTGPATLGVV